MRLFVVFIALFASCNVQSIQRAFVIVSVKTSKNILEPCVQSLVRHQPPTEFVRQTIIFTDDGSPDDTLQYTSKLCHHSPDNFKCIHTHPERRGYTIAINKGIELALQLGNNESDSVVLLNSDVQVSTGWLMKLLLPFITTDNAMLAGPLSNAASYQSIPKSRQPGVIGWATNPYPNGLTADFISAEVNNLGLDLNFPRLSILNGFCLAIRMSLFQYVDLFDAQSFSSGYGEEVDFAIRVKNAGFSAYVVPTVYIHHIKTASFQVAERDKLKIAANHILLQKYEQNIKQFNSKEAVKFRLKLDSLSEHISSIYDLYQKQYPKHAFVGYSLAVASHCFTLSHTGEPLIYNRGCSLQSSSHSISLLRLASAMNSYGVKVTYFNISVHEDVPLPANELFDHTVIMSDSCLILARIRSHLHLPNLTDPLLTWRNRKRADSNQQQYHYFFHYAEDAPASPIMREIVPREQKLFSCDTIRSHNSDNDNYQDNINSGGSGSGNNRSIPFLRTKSTGTVHSSLHVSVDSKRALKPLLKRLDKSDGSAMLLPPCIDRLEGYANESYLVHQYGKNYVIIRPEASRYPSLSTLNILPSASVSILVSLYNYPNQRNIQFCANALYHLLTESAAGRMDITIYGDRRSTELQLKYYKVPVEIMNAILHSPFVEFVPALFPPDKGGGVKGSTDNIPTHDTTLPPTHKAIDINFNLNQYYSLLRSHDLVLDMGRWQWSSRGAIEAMAVGCIPVLPTTGIGPDLCTRSAASSPDDPLCLSFDTSNAIAYATGIREYSKTSAEDRALLVQRAMQFAHHYSAERAAAELGAHLKDLIRANQQTITAHM